MFRSAGGRLREGASGVDRYDENGCGLGGVVVNTCGEEAARDAVRRRGRP